MIIMYSTGCPNCKRLESRLKVSGLSYEVCQDMERIKSLNLTNIPVLDVDGKLYTYRAAISYNNNYIKGEEKLED